MIIISLSWFCLLWNSTSFRIKYPTQDKKGLYSRLPELLIIFWTCAHLLCSWTFSLLSFSTYHTCIHTHTHTHTCTHAKTYSCLSNSLCYFHYIIHHMVIQIFPNFLHKAPIYISFTLVIILDQRSTIFFFCKEPDFRLCGPIGKTEQLFSQKL